MSMFRILNFVFRIYLGFTPLEVQRRSSYQQGRKAKPTYVYLLLETKLLLRLLTGFRILKLGFLSNLEFMILYLGFVLAVLFYAPGVNAGIIGKPPTNLGLVPLEVRNKASAVAMGNLLLTGQVGYWSTPLEVKNCPQFSGGRKAKAANALSLFLTQIHLKLLTGSMNPVRGRDRGEYDINGKRRFYTIAICL